MKYKITWWEDCSEQYMMIIDSKEEITTENKWDIFHKLSHGDSTKVRDYFGDWHDLEVEKLDEENITSTNS